jgi:hypothetical protein
MPLTRRNSGRTLNALWGVGANHALYNHEGIWYHHLERFPGALFDANGYMLFPTEESFISCSGLRITQHAKAAKGISKLPGYRRVT